jgi:hypothetical protein
VFCLQNGSGDLSECTSSIGSPNKAPGAHLSRSEFNVQQFQIAHEDTIQAVTFQFNFFLMLSTTCLLNFSF